MLRDLLFGLLLSVLWGFAFAYILLVYILQGPKFNPVLAM